MLRRDVLARGRALRDRETGRRGSTGPPPRRRHPPAAAAADPCSAPPPAAQPEPVDALPGVAHHEGHAGHEVQGAQDPVQLCQQAWGWKKTGFNDSG